MLTKIGSEKEITDLVATLRGVEGIVVHEPMAKFELSGGGVSDFYLDIKRAYGNPLITRQIAKIMVRHLSPDTTFVAASGYGGLPLGAKVSDLTGLPLGMIRDKEKGHGKGGLIDGFVPGKEDRGIIVDDVLTTGGSIRKARQVITGFGAGIPNCFVVVDRGHPELDFDVSYILRVEDINQP